MKPRIIPEKDLSVVTTKDGSHTVRRHDLGVTYHSIFGALQESQHVFIQNGLSSLPNLSTSEVVQVLELGFGTGLNALLTLDYSIGYKKRIVYSAIEPFPLQPHLIYQLNYPLLEPIGEKARSSFYNLHKDESDTFIDSYFHLKKFNVQIHDFQPKSNFDIIFYDAFSFDTQPKLWSPEIFCLIYSWVKSDGLLVTYAAKGVIKRNLKAAGFHVETRQGPPGKREMIRAVK